MTTTRTTAPGQGDERSMLLHFLEFHRATLALKCESLDGAQLAERSVPPSGLSLLGLIRHMADVERNWFRRRMEGGDPAACFRTEVNPHADFDEATSNGVSEAFAIWEAECAYSRSVVDHYELDDAASWLRNGEQISLRWILVHMIEEYARHNGHADLLRESIDGATGT